MNETHAFLIEKLKDAFPDATSDRELLKLALRNYRKDKGMSLTFEAFKYLESNDIYSFEKLSRPNYLNSRELVLFDTLSTTPYYIGINFIYISDELHSFTLNMVDNFDDFLNYLKENKTRNTPLR